MSPKKRHNKVSTMTPFRICGFVFVVIGLLACVCATFPPEGVSMGNVQLRFPSIDDMLSVSSSLEQEPSPEELLAARVEQMRLTQEAEYVDFFTNNPARIHFPQDSVTYFDAFYDALDMAYMTPVRIVHYGDSQIEEDRISKELRNRLQDQFGGGGVGLLPMMTTYYNLTIQEQVTGSYERYSLITNETVSKRKGNLYGPLIQVSTIEEPISLVVSKKKSASGSGVYANHVSVWVGSSAMRVSVGDSTVKLPQSTEKLRVARFSMKDSTTTTRVKISGAGDVYGLSIENKTGVNVDNIPLRGCSGTIFGGVSQEQLRTYFSETNTKLVILQFGGNSMPGIRSQQAIDRVLAMIRPSVQHMINAAPDAKFLFIGPSDMTDLKSGERKSYAMLSSFDHQLCEMVNGMGIAYWSLFESMGGENSMLKWVTSSPRLAGSDYVHFTRLGAEKAGEMLYNTIITGYNYYKIRERFSYPMEYIVSQIDSLGVDSSLINTQIEKK